MEEKALLNFREIHKVSHPRRVRNVLNVKKSDSLPDWVDCHFRQCLMAILIVGLQPQLAGISQHLVTVLQVEARDDFRHVEAYGPFTE